MTIERVIYHEESLMITKGATETTRSIRCTHVRDRSAIGIRVVDTLGAAMIELVKAEAIELIAWLTEYTKKLP